MFAFVAFIIFYLITAFCGASTDIEILLLIFCASMLIQVDVDVYRLWRNLHDDRY